MQMAYKNQGSASVKLLFFSCVCGVPKEVKNTKTLFDFRSFLYRPVWNIWWCLYGVLTVLCNDDISIVPTSGARRTVVRLRVLGWTTAVARQTRLRNTQSLDDETRKEEKEKDEAESKQKVIMTKAVKLVCDAARHNTSLITSIWPFQCSDRLSWCCSVTWDRALFSSWGPCVMKHIHSNPQNINV